jgi:hypothetical protein
MRVVFLAPDIGAVGTFYEIFADVMKVAARQFDIALEVVGAEKQSQEVLLQKARSIVGGPQRPDFMIAVNYKSVGQQLLSVNAAAGVGTFFVVEALSEGELSMAGALGGDTSGYLGQIVPDDVEAGQLLAQTLIAAARRRKLVGGGGKIRLGVVAGEHTGAGNARFKGLRAVLKQAADVEQAGFQYGTWDEAEGKSVTRMMLRAVPDLGVLWCANDAMALGALAAVVEAGRKPGQDVLIGGIDLSDRALAEVAAGRLEVSIGGHVVDGAGALIALHEHHEKRGTEERQRTTHLVAVGQQDAARYLRFIEDRGWHKVDFRRFSRVTNPDGAGEGLSLEAMMGR